MKNFAKINVTLESGHMASGEISLTDFSMEVDRYGVTRLVLVGYFTAAAPKPEVPPPSVGL